MHRPGEDKRLSLGTVPARESALIFPNLNRKRKAESRALTFAFTFGPDSAVVHLNQPAGEGQSQSGALVLAGQRALHLGKRLEYTVHVIFPQADSGIHHADLHFPPQVAGAAGHARRFRGDDLGSQTNGSALGSEFNRVGQQIIKNLPQPERVGSYEFGDVCQVCQQADILPGGFFLMTTRLCSSSGFNLISEEFSSSLPASIFERSRISSTKERRCLLL